MAQNDLLNQLLYYHHCGDENGNNMPSTGFEPICLTILGLLYYPLRQEGTLMQSLYPHLPVAGLKQNNPKVIYNTHNLDISSSVLMGLLNDVK